MVVFQLTSYCYSDTKAKEPQEDRQTLMIYIRTLFSFVFVFVGIFFLAGLFLMPHLPPVPDHPVSAFEAEFWKDNWIGYLLGAVIGGFSARSTLKKNSKKTAS